MAVTSNIDTETLVEVEMLQQALKEIQEIVDVHNARNPGWPLKVTVELENE